MTNRCKFLLVNELCTSFYYSSIYYFNFYKRYVHKYFKMRSFILEDNLVFLVNHVARRVFKEK